MKELSNNDRAVWYRRVRRERKQLLIEKLGGSCVRCGYNKSLQALCFHHIDPSTKSFELGSSALHFSMERLYAEADKCEVLCANCHAEEHDTFLYE